MRQIMSPNIVRAQILEGGSVRIMAHILSITHGVILGDDLASLTWKVFDASDDLDAPDETGTGTFVIDDVWLDANLTGNGWPAADTEGYNFDATIGPTPFLQTRNRIGQFRIEVFATLASGEYFPAVFALLDVDPSYTKAPA